MQPVSQRLPQLNTTHFEPLLFLERHFLSQQEKISQWFSTQWKQTKAPVYGSVDLRNAGFKLAPIDMNLFPAGFNNLNPDFLSLYVEAARKSIENTSPGTKRILLIPEQHTRNQFYWENIENLCRMLRGAGYLVRIASLSSDIIDAQNIMLASGANLVVEPLLRSDDRLGLAGFDPDIILLNNDLSDGVPDILQNVSQAVLPPARLGWSNRLKSGHFQEYANVVNEFSALVNIDPWLIAPLFKHCGEVDFMQQDGLSCLASNAEKLFEQIKEKYTEYNISQQPFLIVKADAGTYGMAVMTVRDPDELKNLNRKQRTKMSSTKGKQPVKRVIIQEGVYTVEVTGEDQAVAEPVVYLWGECTVGGFYRVHKNRGVDESLNAPGMQFEPMPFSSCCNEPREDALPDASQNRFYTYGVVARLSMLAAAREMQGKI